MKKLSITKRLCFYREYAKRSGPLGSIVPTLIDFIVFVEEYSSFDLKVLKE